MPILLHPKLLINAYCQGRFPMADGDEIYWYDPDPRAILPLDDFHVPRSLARKVRQQLFDVSIDEDFEAVIRTCAAPTTGRESTWLNETLIQAYLALHKLGFAHSVECRRNDRLVGGLYGVSIGGLFAGESMFSRSRDASKVALVHLVNRLNERGFTLLDTQFITPHLQRFGAIEISRDAYKQRLIEALAVTTRFI